MAIGTALATLVKRLVGNRLTFVAALVSGTPGVNAHGTVGVFNHRIADIAVVNGADLVATLGPTALALFAFLVVGVFDQNVTVGTLEGAAVNALPWYRRVEIAVGQQLSPILGP